MILIAHRGNLNGPILALENSPNYIDDAITAGFHVEIDIWEINGKLFLGHDYGIYEIDKQWLIKRHDKLWLHCKNIECVIYFSLSEFPFHYFWHENDKLTLTSLNYLWVYPGLQPVYNSIAVMPELFNDNIGKCIGICSDYISNYR